MTEADERASAEGCLLGLACGDALARPVEFRTAEAMTGRRSRLANGARTPLLVPPRWRSRER